MKKYADFCARQKLQELDPNRKISDKEYQLWYGKVEEFFRLKPGTLSQAAAAAAPHQNGKPAS